MAITFTRATPLHRASQKDGGHVRFAFRASVTSPALSPTIVATLANATLVAAAPFGDLNRVLRARDVGIGSIAAGTALTQAQAREILLCDVAGAAAGSEGVLTNRNVARARASCVMARPTSAGGGVHFIPALDASVDASGRLTLVMRTTVALARPGSNTNVANANIGYIDILFQHSFFRT